MDARATRRGVPAVVLWGAVGALAWAALTVLLGSGSAHADDQEKGPLDGLTSLVADTVSAVTAPVAPVVDQVVAPVVTQVVAPVQQAVPAVVQTVSQTIAKTPVVGPVTAPVVHTVTETVGGVVAPVTDLLADSPVSQITDPVLETVSHLPIVGGLVADIGVIDAVGEVVGVVDDTTALLGGVTDNTVPPVLEALDPTTPGPGTGTRTDPTSGTPASAQVALASTGITASVSPSALPQRFSASAGSLPLSATDMAADADDGSRAPAGAPSGNPPGVPTAPASSSAGPGGAGGVAHARLGDLNSSPLRAGERTSGASDDALPASPVADTDVSPD